MVETEIKRRVFTVYSPGFSTGELINNFYGNFGTDVFTNAARQIVNMNVRPQAGVVLRPGTTCIYKNIKKPTVLSWLDKRIIVFTETNIEIYSSSYPYTKTTLSYPSGSTPTATSKIIAIDQSAIGYISYISPTGSSHPNGGYLTFSIDQTTHAVSVSFRPLLYTKGAGVTEELSVRGIYIYENRSYLISRNKLYISKLNTIETFADEAAAGSTALTDAFSIELGTNAIAKETLLSLTVTQRYLVITSNTYHYFLIFNDAATNLGNMFSKLSIKHVETDFGRVFSLNGTVHIVGDTFVHHITYNELEKQLTCEDLSMYCSHVHRGTILKCEPRAENGYIAVYILTSDGSICRLVINVNGKTTPAAASWYRLMLHSPDVIQELAEYVDISYFANSVTSHINGMYYVEILYNKEFGRTKYNEEVFPFEYNVQTTPRIQLENIDYLDRMIVATSTTNIRCEVLSDITLKILAADSSVVLKQGDRIELDSSYSLGIQSITSNDVGGIITFQRPPDESPLFKYIKEERKYCIINGIQKQQTFTSDQLALISGLDKLLVKIYVNGNSEVVKWDPSSKYPDSICMKIGQSFRGYISPLSPADPTKKFKLSSVSCVLSKTFGVLTYNRYGEGKANSRFHFNLENYITNATDEDIKSNPQLYPKIKYTDSKALVGRTGVYKLEFEDVEPQQFTNNTLYICSKSGMNLEILSCVFTHSTSENI